MNNINYMNGQTQAVTYAPTGQLLSMTNGYCPGCGTTGFNGYTVVNSYNTRLQPYNLSANSTASPSETILSLTYNFLLGLDNGNVAGITNWLDNTPQHPGVGSVTYGYDALNRITSAQTTGSDCTTLPGGLTKNWGESYTVDAWGNMTTATVTQCSAVPLSVNVNTSNQFANACYDAAGNLLNGSACGQLVYTYNGKNQLVTTGGYTYSYDAEGDRVMKANGTTGTIYARSFGSASMYETDLSGNFQNEYIFLNGRRIARRDASGNQHYYFSDMLGSSSVTGNQTGQIENVEDFYPYGLSRQLITNVPQPYQFTGKERDAESGFDDFGARYYSSYWSRFMTPDWAAKPTAVPYANYGNPQSLNLYSYVENNPTTLGDPDGHEDEGSSVPGGDAYNSAAGQAQYASMTGGDVFEAMNNYSNSMAMAANAQPAAQNNQSGSKSGFWSRLGHGFSNLLHGHSWGYTQESVTHTIVTEGVREPNPVVTAVADSIGVAAAVSRNTRLGAASSLISLASDPTPKNGLLTGASTVVPMIVEGSDVPIAFGFAAYDGSRFAGQVMTDVFTPDALQSDTIPDGNGHLIPDPQATFDSGQAFGPN